MSTKLHIGIFGRRNSGKSSIINALTKQQIAIVSDQPGTTTDPVKKAIEIVGLGPVVLIDTAGIDDEGEVGALRVEKTLDIIKQVDFALLVTDHNHWCSYEMEVVNMFEKNKVPFIIIHNKSDQEKLEKSFEDTLKKLCNASIFDYSTKDAAQLEQLVQFIAKEAGKHRQDKNLLKGLVNAGDVVLLVTPIDNAAPEGRMILPQVQTWRSLMDNDCIMLSCKEDKVVETLKLLSVQPKLVITDSQMFKKVAEQVPANIRLTSFSIILSRQKEYFQKMLEGTKHLSSLKDGDNVLMLESCTHQTSCDDIGRVKIPKMLENFTGKKLQFEYVSGLSAIPDEKYNMVIQCGGCMVSDKQLENRIQPFIDAGIPVSNYGMAIAFINGIFDRAVNQLGITN